jgi:hypothetical protein
MDASKFFTTNAEEWYPNMLVCGDCDTETIAGTLADMLQWAIDHSKVCDTSTYYREFRCNSDEEWIRGSKPLSSKDMLEDKKLYEDMTNLGYKQHERRWVKGE